MKRLSRQRREQIRHLKMGLCQACSEKAWLGGAYCKRHRDNNLKRMRQRTGLGPWRPGGPGRPPLDAP